MKAALLQSGVLEIQDLPTPEPEFEQARVRIHAAGVCHSDLHIVRGGASGLVVAHVGILHHHRDLMRDGGEAGRRAAAVADCGDAGNSDAAFLYRLVASYYDDFGGDLERAVRATLDLVSATGPPSSLNLVATDKSGRVVACRRRSPGDDQAPPPLFYASTTTGALLASAPVAVAA